MTSSSSAFLGLAPRACGLPDSLSDDVELVDRLLGAVLHEQEDRALLDVARRLYTDTGAAGPRALVERIPELNEARFVQRLLRAYAVLFQHCERSASAAVRLKQLT